MTISFEVSATLPASPETLYSAWLDSAKHSAMTGAAAEVSDKVGAAFTAWDGYISGENTELEPGKRIVQAWRTVEFSDDDPDSQLEIIFEKHADGTQVIIRHTNLPPHGTQYEQGWIDNYFEPMKSYFS
jgi:activator of HSP90 ATPase